MECGTATHVRQLQTGSCNGALVKGLAARSGWLLDQQKLVHAAAAGPQMQHQPDALTQLSLHNPMQRGPGCLQPGYQQSHTICCCHLSLLQRGRLLSLHWRSTYMQCSKSVLDGHSVPTCLARLHTAHSRIVFAILFWSFAVPLISLTCFITFVFRCTCLIWTHFCALVNRCINIHAAGITTFLPWNMSLNLSVAFICV